jgi:3-phosphoshikimate 1-carboxyvinyltransferase
MTDGARGAAEPRAVEPVSGPLDATVVVPGSKSITNRALMCAALAEGTSTLTGVLDADDTEAMVVALQGLGIAVDEPVPATLEVGGCAGTLPRPSARLDARLSGTTSRFLLPALTLGAGPYVLDGAPPLRARPMADGIDALRALGATVDDGDTPGRLPVRVSTARGVGTDGATGVGPKPSVRLPGSVSSQFASGLLLAAPAMPGGLQVRLEGEVVSRPYLALTVAVMRAFGAEVTGDGSDAFTVAPVGYRATTYRIEPDASAASYFFAAAAICGGRVRIDGLGRHALQGDVAFVHELARMGAEVTVADDHVEVVGPETLRGIDADFSQISDTAQTLAAVAVFADAPTTITGIGFIRRKETDRIGAVVTELRRCGIEATELDDGFRIVPGEPEPATIETYDDHRMAMSFALLGLRAPGIRIADPGCVAKTFPGYWDALDTLRATAAPTSGIVP